MDQRRHLITSLHKLLRPVQTHSIISKSRHSRLIGVKKILVITAFSHNKRILYRIIQKGYLLISKLHGCLLDHMSKTARA